MKKAIKKQVEKPKAKTVTTTRMMTKNEHREESRTPSTTLPDSRKQFSRTDKPIDGFAVMGMPVPMMIL